MRIAVLAVLLLAGCAHGEYHPEGTLLPTGQWGGDQIGLEVDASGAGQISLPCASARFEGPIKLDIGGHFFTSGTYTQGSGAPPTQPPAPVPANIGGRLDQDGTLWLDVATRDSYSVRSARLWRSRESVIHHCP